MFGNDFGVLVREDSFGYCVSSDRQTNEVIRRFTLENDHGMSVEVITYGATVTSIKFPDKNGEISDVVLGFDDISGYYKSPYYIGCIVGRVCNRIANGTFRLNNEKYQLSLNHGKHHLHGGFKGYDKVLWDSHVEGSCVRLSYTSCDNEEGYPGEVLNQVSYSLTEQNEFIIDVRSTSTKLTPINITSHLYFNLAGHNSGSIEDHEVFLNADKYTPVDENFIPTGEIESVDGSVFDLKNSSKMADKLKQASSGGFDHNFCINRIDDTELKLAACIAEASTKRRLEVYTTQPGLHFYTANFLPEDDSLKGKQNSVYKKHSAMCFETQNFPNAINQSNFPTSVIGPGDCYHQKTVYKFSIMDETDEENSTND